METLKILIEIVKDLPEMAVWLVVAYFIYQSLIVGSIYGVIKVVAKYTHDAVVAKKTEKPIDKEIRATLDGMVITGNLNQLIGQLDRLKGIRSCGSSGSPYIHSADIDFLRKAIDEKLDRDSNK
jgi:hypothetical protein